MSFRGLVVGVLLAVSSITTIACGDSTNAIGESCVSTDSREDCDPGLLCAAKPANTNQLTCQKECSQLGDSGVGCAESEICTKTATGSGTFTCQPK